MQDQRIEDEDPGSHEARTDNTVLDFMLVGPSWPWSVEEIVRELGNKVDAEDAVARLIGTGLAHRLGEFIFPTRTARRACELQIGTI
jgi:hypothetical protein